MTDQADALLRELLTTQQRLLALQERALENQQLALERQRRAVIWFTPFLLLLLLSAYGPSLINRFF